MEFISTYRLGEKKGEIDLTDVYQKLNKYNFIISFKCFFL